MSRSVTFKVFKFEELSDEAKERAIEQFRYMNVDYGWWNCVYEMAEEIGFTITEFDLDSPNLWRPQIKGELNVTLLESFKLIRKNLSRNSELYKISKDYVRDFIKAYREMKANDEELTVEDFIDEARDLECEYKKAILEEFLSILRKEYDYQTSDEAIKEILVDGENEFYQNGTKYI
jgi:hypothetical protein